MLYVGADLHKKSITLCVMTVADGGERMVKKRTRFACDEPGNIRQVFQRLRPLQLAVEATSSYEWFFLLIEDIMTWSGGRARRVKRGNADRRNRR